MVSEDIHRIVETAATMAAQKAIDKYCECPPCRLSPEAMSEMQHFMGMVKDIGGNSYSNGIETMRSSNKFIARYIKLCERVGNSILALAVAGIFGIVWLVVGKGCQSWVKATFIK